MGKCPQCGEWNSLVETVVSTSKTPKFQNSKTSSRNLEPVLLSSVSAKKIERLSAKISELDRVLGGGIVAGQVVLIAGEPGIGKSTLLLQVADQLVSSRQSLDFSKKKNSVQRPESSVLYVSGEESINQIAIRSQRLRIRNKNIMMLEETDIDAIIGNIEGNISPATNCKLPAAIIIDSIQTMQTSDLSGMAGSVGQIRECTYRLVRLAKSQNIPIFVVGHVTKQGTVAGPAVLMHIVDTVLWFEGDREKTLRMLTARKNRFGPTDEVGIFTMEDKGLVSINDSSKLFLGQSGKSVAGSAVSSVLKGTRPILVEIQSLVNPTKLAYPRRVAQGIDSKRLEMLLAVLGRRCNIPIYDFDCFVNVAGGISVRGDPAVDLAVCLSIASSYFDKPLPKSTIFIGEVGLLGDIREVVAQEKRVKEARRLGYGGVVSNEKVKYLSQVIRNLLR